jgi:DNA modification methylase
MIDTTSHTIHYEDAGNLSNLTDESVSLVVTSPPYPMIEMWDDSFTGQNPAIGKALEADNSDTAFELMHRVLDKVWRECYRVLHQGGIACINIGDATRTVGNRFRLFPNHSRIISSFLDLGFSNLPNILWRKQTNAPNKFMGSGMLPPGAYVTLEHEFILVFRKGNKREFPSEGKTNRRQSSYFWEERNKWFSDLWNLKGTSQFLSKNEIRDRSGAFPFEIPYRLINMFSVRDDTVLDPFIGTGTTTLAAIASGRNSVGYELESIFQKIIQKNLLAELNLNAINDTIRHRILNHKKFIKNRVKEKGKNSIKYENGFFNFPVMTRQEKKLILQFIKSVHQIDQNSFQSSYIQQALMDYQGANSLFAQV